VTPATEAVWRTVADANVSHSHPMVSRLAGYLWNAVSLICEERRQHAERLAGMETSLDHAHAEVERLKTRAEVAEGYLSELSPRYAEVVASRSGLRNALRHYANPDHWLCARCGKHDPLNCFNSRYVGLVRESVPCNMADADVQPWSIAAAAIDAALAQAKPETPACGGAE
jgi:hypothetical protein